MNEQINLFNENDWKSDVSKTLDTIIEEKLLPPKSLHLMPNKGKDEEISSYSICIYEPEFPEIKYEIEDPGKNSVVLRMKENEDSYELILNKYQFESVEKPGDFQTKSLKSEPDYVHVFLPKVISALQDYIKWNTEYKLLHYTSKAKPFGCCSKFVECSDARRCVHENKLYSMACYYRHHLDAGEIFYGKNKNI